MRVKSAPRPPAEAHALTPALEGFCWFVCFALQFKTRQGVCPSISFKVIMFDVMTDLSLLLCILIFEMVTVGMYKIII